MIDLSQLSDPELLASLKEDKIGAFRAIYNRYWGKLYGDAYKRIKSKEAAEEIVQEVFTNFWTKRQALQPQTNIAAYLHLAVYNSIIDQYRKKLVKEKYKEVFKIEHSEADNSTEDSILMKELTYTIETEVSHLPDKCRSVYELSRNEHKTNREIAAYLGISEKTVENHLTKALRRLRLSLTHYLVLVLALLLK